MGGEASALSDMPCVRHWGWALDRRLCLQRVGMGRLENFRLRFENLVNMARACRLCLA
jgi:hypothetical protein